MPLANTDAERMSNALRMVLAVPKEGGRAEAEEALGLNLRLLYGRAAVSRSSVFANDSPSRIAARFGDHQDRVECGFSVPVATRRCHVHI